MKWHPGYGEEGLDLAVDDYGVVHARLQKLSTAAMYGLSLA